MLTFKQTSKMWGGMMRPSLETTPKTITVAGNFVFIILGTLNRPNLYFEGAGNGPVVISWIGREHDLYSGASPISLVEHCVTFKHDRRLLSLLGFVHNWPTSRWSATTKRKPVFIKRKWNHVVFSRETILSFHSVVNIDCSAYSVVKVWIFALTFKSSASFVEIFFGFKGRVVDRTL